ncbi:tetratricopeptide repeat protein [candidate division CSSED10-310 bacterium]|uniref:Tetratricopeptide repeat protein n=1 Tax=candidate division CSSED10-310 bacterium TaxID=2855610 RepID=A0ABV6YUT4_UNCC1
MKKFLYFGFILLTWLLVVSGCTTLPHKTSSKPSSLEGKKRTVDQEIKKPPRDTTKASYHYGLGKIFLSEGEIDKALTNFKEALTYDPDSAYLNYTLGFLLLSLADAERHDMKIRLGAFQRAEYYLENAYAIDNQDLDTLLALADTKSALQKHEAAIALFKKVISMDPKKGQVQFSLAQELTKVHRFRESNDYLKNLLPHPPRLTNPHFLMGFNLYQLEKWDQALPYFQKAYQFNAYDPNLVDYLGRLYEYKKQYQEALDIYKRIAYVSPKDSLFYEKFVRMLMILKKYEEAEQVIQDILADGVEKYMWYYFLGLIYEMREDLKTAVTYFEKAFSINNEDRRLIVELSYIYYRLGNKTKSTKILEDAVKRFPNDPDYYLYLGEAYLRAEDYQKTLKTFKQGISLDKNNENLHMQLATVYEKLKLDQEVERTLEKVIDINKQNADALNFLGYFYAERSMKLTKAETYLEQALVLDPENGAFIDSLGWIYYKQKRYNDALEKLLQATRILDHKDAVVLDHLADTYYQLGCFAIAVNVWKKALTLTEKDASDNQERLRQKISENEGKIDNANDPGCQSPDFILRTSTSPDEGTPDK